MPSAKINTTEDFAIEFKNYISKYALNNKELKSCAEMIQYPWGVFKFKKKKKLKNELVFLNAFIGSITLRVCLNDNQVSQKNIDKIVNMYTNKLLAQELSGVTTKNYQKRLSKWSELFNDFEKPTKFSADMTKLSSSFYKFLTNNKCDPMTESKLVLRFNGYMKRYIHYISQM
ncbi:MAG: hypothetical protein ACOCRX_09965, partial [Candidatus Woesearchaeota archaeon]